VLLLLLQQSRAGDMPLMLSARARTKKQHYVPSVDMALAYLSAGGQGAAPVSCPDKFARSFFDPTAASTLLAHVLHYTREPKSVALPSTCTLAGWQAGQPCTLSVDEPVSETTFQVRRAVTTATIP
jgi:hypothetical protein